MLWVLIRVPWQGTFREYPQHMFIIHGEITKILCGFTLRSGAMLNIENKNYGVAAKAAHILSSKCITQFEILFLYL